MTLLAEQHIQDILLSNSNELGCDIDFGGSKRDYNSEKFDSLRARLVVNMTAQARDITKRDRIKEEVEADLRNNEYSFDFTPAVDINNPISLPRFNKVVDRSKRHFQALQEWEGYVVDVEKNEFTARLLDITANDKVEREEATFLMDDLSSDDQGRIKSGSVFRWVIGYLAEGGTKRRFSQIILRRLPQWSEAELKDADSKAFKSNSEINWE